MCENLWKNKCRTDIDQITWYFSFFLWEQARHCKLLVSYEFLSTWSLDLFNSFHSLTETYTLDKSSSDRIYFYYVFFMQCLKSPSKLEVMEQMLTLQQKFAMEQVTSNANIFMVNKNKELSRCVLQNGDIGQSFSWWSREMANWRFYQFRYLGKLCKGNHEYINKLPNHY